MAGFQNLTVSLGSLKTRSIVIPGRRVRDQVPVPAELVTYDRRRWGRHRQRTERRHLWHWRWRRRHHRDEVAARRGRETSSVGLQAGSNQRAQLGAWAAGHRRGGGHVEAVEQRVRGVAGHRALCPLQRNRLSRSYRHRRRVRARPWVRQQKLRRRGTVHGDHLVYDGRRRRGRWALPVEYMEATELLRRRQLRWRQWRGRRGRSVPTGRRPGAGGDPPPRGSLVTGRWLSVAVVDAGALVDAAERDLRLHHISPSQQE